MNYGLDPADTSFVWTGITCKNQTDPYTDPEWRTLEIAMGCFKFMHKASILHARIHDQRSRHCVNETIIKMYIN